MYGEITTLLDAAHNIWVVSTVMYILLICSKENKEWLKAANDKDIKLEFTLTFLVVP